MERQKSKNRIKPIRKSKCDVNLPDSLDSFLNKEQSELLKCYIANYTYQELIISRDKIKGSCRRSEVMDLLIDLGRALALYRVLECEIVPEHTYKSKLYLKGFTDCKNQIWRSIQDEKRRWKTLKA